MLSRVIRTTILALTAITALPALAAQAPAQAPAKRPMTVEDLWAVERVGGPALSPDGKWAAFTVTTYSMEKNKSNGDIWVVPADGSAPPKRLTWNEESDAAPAWSPDGTRLAFVSKRGDAPPQLHLLPMAGGEAEPVTELPVAVEDPKWLDDGRIAFLATTFPDLNDDFAAVKKRLDEQKDDKVQAKVTDNRLLRFWDTYMTDGTALHVFVIDLATRKVTDLLPGSTRLMGLQGGADWDVSPDGREIAFAANRTEPPYRTLNYDIWLLPVPAPGEKPAAPRSVTAADPSDESSPVYSPDGRAIAYGRTRRPDIDSDYTRLARYDRTTGRSEGLVEGWDVQPAGWTFTPDGRTLLFHAEDRGKVHLYSLPLDGAANGASDTAADGGSDDTDEPRLLVRGGMTGDVEAGPDGLFVFSRQSITRPADLAAARLTADGATEPVALTSFNEKLLAQLDLGRVEDVTYEGAGGDPVQMFVILPPGFDPARKWPLVHVIHGGPHGATLDQFHYRWNLALMASPGYVVAGVNFHGSTGAGQAFADAILGAHGDKPFVDIMKATDHLVGRGFVDESRMAAAGGSYGGYLVSWILGHTNRFAALINHAGVYDLMAQFASDATWGRPNNYGSSPWEDPARVDLWSPSRFAKDFRTPTLILHGEKDYRVPVTQGINLHGVLTAKGVPSRIVVFPSENHWVLKPQSARLWWKEVFAWLDRYIGTGAGGAQQQRAK